MIASPGRDAAVEAGAESVGEGEEGGWWGGDGGRGGGGGGRGGGLTGDELWVG